MDLGASFWCSRHCTNHHSSCLLPQSVCVCVCVCVVNVVNQVESFEAARITHHEQVERLNKSITDLKAESHTAGREHATKLRETSESLLEAQKALAAAHQTASEMETALQTAQSDLTKARAEMVHLQDREAELTSVDALHKTQLADLKDAREEARAKTEEARELAQQLDELKKTAAAAEAKVVWHSTQRVYHHGNLLVAGA
jgi:chromosome segregation ATPase